MDALKYCRLPERDKTRSAGRARQGAGTHVQSLIIFNFGRTTEENASENKNLEHWRESAARAWTAWLEAGRGGVCGSQWRGIYSVRMWHCGPHREITVHTGWQA